MGINANAISIVSVAQAFLAMTQEINQDFVNVQSNILSCHQNKNYLYDCISKLQKAGKSNEDINKICNLLSCNVSDIIMKQKFNINLNIKQDADTKAQFTKQLLNAISQNSSQQDSSINLSGGANIENITTTSDKIFEQLTSTSFQQSIQSVAGLQNIIMTDPSIVNNVNMSEAVKLMIQTLQENSDVQESLSDLSSSIIQAAAALSSAGLDELIMWIVRIVLAIITLILLFYCSDLIFDMYGLYVSI